jgi:prepilin-type N-terminal cleavage/methylation domain-containing protein/prepilin-type processing-associated H-X9-DG protein
MKSGFTLLELSTVLAILVVLAGTLFPILSQARDAARRARCLSNLRQLALAHRTYVQDYDETLPSWQLLHPGGTTTWVEFMRPYFRDPQILDEGLTSPKEKHQFTWLADYALCAWGPGGKATWEKPYWRWPGAPGRGPNGPCPMRLVDVRRPAEAVQFTDGLTIRYNLEMANRLYNPGKADSLIWRRHRNGLLNGVFLDGHARAINHRDWNRIDQDERGYFYTLAAADR